MLDDYDRAYGWPPNQPGWGVDNILGLVTPSSGAFRALPTGLGLCFWLVWSMGVVSAVCQDSFPVVELEGDEEGEPCKTSPIPLSRCVSARCLGVLKTGELVGLSEEPPLAVPLSSLNVASLGVPFCVDSWYCRISRSFGGVPPPSAESWGQTPLISGCN